MTDQEFRELTERVFVAEKQGFWSDWTEEQQEFISSGNWVEFSRSRGYTEDEIIECGLWQDEVQKRSQDGGEGLVCAADLFNKKAIEKLEHDFNGEILKSSIGPASIRGGMIKLEDKIKSHPLAKGPDDFPLKHIFTGTQYIRESFVPKGVLFTTKIHKVEHPMFIMSGEVSILTEEGFKRIKAPYWAITKKGTKRVILTHEDSVCVTVHPTNKMSLEEVEDDFWASTFEEIGLECEHDSIMIGGQG